MSFCVAYEFSLRTWTCWLETCVARVNVAIRVPSQTWKRTPSPTILWISKKTHRLRLQPHSKSVLTSWVKLKIIDLVSGWPTPLKYMSSSVGMMKLPIYGKIKIHVPKCSKPSASYRQNGGFVGLYPVQDASGLSPNLEDLKSSKIIWKHGKIIWNHRKKSSKVSQKLVLFL